MWHLALGSPHVPFLMTLVSPLLIAANVSPAHLQVLCLGNCLLRPSRHANSTPLSFGLLLMLANYKNWGFPSNSKLKLKYICLLTQTVDLPQPVPDKSGSPTATKQVAWGGWLVPDRGSWLVPDSRGPTRGHICLGHLPWVDQVVPCWLEAILNTCPV